MVDCNSLSSSLVRIPYRVIAVWIFFVVIGFYLMVPSTINNDDFYKVNTALKSHQLKQYMPQAIVFIAMGKLAREGLVEDAISAVRLIGHWNDEILILTDRPKCFNTLVEGSENTKTITVPSKATIIEIKTMKAEIFTYLPSNIDRVLYLDVDILITRNLGFFIQDLNNLLSYHYQLQMKKNNPETSLSTKQNFLNTTYSYQLHDFDFAAFLDAKGHYVGFCSGCEKWHTGVMYLRRNHGVECMKYWASLLSSGKYDTDQESLDDSEKSGHCSKTIAIPSRHLLFAKDYIGMVLTSGQTFVHLTAANRAEDQDYFYKDVIIPRVRNSLHPPLKPYTGKEKPKEC